MGMCVLNFIRKKKISYSFSFEVTSDITPNIVVESRYSGVSRSLTLLFLAFLCRHRNLTLEAWVFFISMIIIEPAS